VIGIDDVRRRSARPWTPGARLSAALTLAALAAIAAYLWGQRSELSQIVVLSPLQLGLCVLSTALYLGSNGLLTHAVVNRLGRRIQLRECMSLSLVSTAVSATLPGQGGLVVRAAYLKRVHDFEYSRFIGGLIGGSIITVVVCSSIATAAVTWIIVRGREGIGSLFIASTVCLLGSLTLCAAPRLQLGGNWFFDRICAVSDAWHRLRAEPPFVARMTLVVGLHVAGQLLSFWTALGAIGVRLDPVEATAVGALGMLSGYLGITPGGLGIYETVVALVGLSVADVPASQSVLASLLSRAVLMAVLLVSTPLAVASLQNAAPRRSESIQ
jgi:uncharacterized membrane protein YbhN (UPF0104 family)